MSSNFKSIRTDEGGSVASDRLGQLLDLADSYLPPRDPWAGLDRAEYIGTDPAADGQHILRVVVRGQPQQWRLSREGFHLVEARRGDHEDPVDTFLYDWRPVEGVVMPHYVEISFGTGMYSVQWDHVEVLREVSEALFDVPEG